MPDLEIKAAVSKPEMEGILALQAKNLKAALDAQEIKAQGFVTLEHNLEQLERIAQPHHHVIALDKHKQVVGYALTMLPLSAQRVPKLQEFFQRLQKGALSEQLASEKGFFAMGQVCIAKAWRGQGLLSALYVRQAELMRLHFDWVVTEIDNENKRSLAAHLKLDFLILETYRAESGKTWHIVGKKLCA